ncbi:recombinase family protein [bacterium]|nr:recombinase family protein [bacterium]
MGKKHKPFGDAVAFSYIRFSSPEQAKGHSLKRQSGGPEPWCEKNGVSLSGQTFKDLGVSAYTGEHRTNPDRHGLALFLNALREQKIPRGSLLIIENLDRLTRENLRPAFNLVNQILDAGIHIVTLEPEKVYRHDATGQDQMFDVMQMVWEFSRANSESARKSFLVGKAWADKKERARAGDHILTHKLPAWVEEKGGELRLIPDRAAVVRRVFALSASGLGHAAIVSRLTAEKVQPIGTSGKWSRSFVANILKDRRAVGEYQPKKRDGSADGDPIQGYFPPVVDESAFYVARGEAEKRATKPGRVGSELVNVFAGLLKNSREGDAYYLATRTDGLREGRSKSSPTHQQVLINVNSAEGRSKCHSFPYLPFERGVLSKLRAVDPREVVGESPAADEVRTLSGEVAGLEALERELEAALEEGEVAAVVRKLRDIQGRKADGVKRLEAAKARAASPLSEAWGECQTLLSVIEDATDKDDARIRLRSTLRRVVSECWVLFFSKGKTRGAAVQIFFAGGEARRDYLILYRPPIVGFNNSRKEAALTVGSGTGFDGDLDLRNPAHALSLEASLVRRLERKELVAG